MRSGHEAWRSFSDAVDVAAQHANERRSPWDHREFDRLRESQIALANALQAMRDYLLLVMPDNN